MFSFVKRITIYKKKHFPPIPFKQSRGKKAKDSTKLQFKQLTIQQFCLKLQSVHCTQNNPNTQCFPCLAFLSVMISNTEKWICYKHWGFFLLHIKLFWVLSFLSTYPLFPLEVLFCKLVQLQAEVTFSWFPLQILSVNGTWKIVYTISFSATFYYCSTSLHFPVHGKLLGDFQMQHTWGYNFCLILVLQAVM